MPYSFSAVLRQLVSGLPFFLLPCGFQVKAVTTKQLFVIAYILTQILHMNGSYYSKIYKLLPGILCLYFIMQSFNGTLYHFLPFPTPTLNLFWTVRSYSLRLYSTIHLVAFSYDRNCTINLSQLINNYSYPFDPEESNNLHFSREFSFRTRVTELLNALWALSPIIQPPLRLFIGCTLWLTTDSQTGKREMGFPMNVTHLSCFLQYK